MSDDGSALRWAKLNRNLFKLFLQERYGRRLAERMVSFIDGQLFPIARIEFKLFVKLLKDFIKGGYPLW